jgi:vitamin B12 transporter
MNRKISCLMVISIMGMVVLGGTVQAAENKVAEYVLDPMMVTAQRVEKSDLDTPAAVEVLTNEQLVATGAHNIQEALKFAVGISYQAQGPKGISQGTMNSKIVIRGVEKGTLVLIDGVPLNQSGRYNLDNIATEIVEKVEIVRGGGSVLYGSEATGGVINIITKGTRKNSISTSFGNYGQQNHAINMQAGKLGFSYAYDKLGQVDNISDPAGGKPVGNFYNVTRNENNNFNVRYNFNEELYLTHTYNQSNAHYVYEYEPQNNAVNKDVIYTVKEHMTQLHFDNKDIKAILSYTNREQNNYSKANKKVGSVYYPTLDSIENAGYNDKTVALDVQKNWKFKKNFAILGFNVQKDDCEYDQNKLTVSTNKLAASNRDFSRNMYSVYGQYNYVLNDASNLAFSARETWTSGTEAEGFSGQNYNKFTPEIEYLYKINETTSAYAKAGQSFMMPTFTQIFGSGNIVGSGDLKPQEGNHYEIGLKRNVNNHAWRLALYNYKIDNSIESKWGSDGVYYTNEDIRNTGIELSCQVKMSKYLNGNWSVSYSNPQKYSTTTEYGDTTIPKWRDYYGKIQLTGGLSYTKEKWSGALNATFLGDRTRDIDAEDNMKPYLFTSLSLSYNPKNNSKIYLNVDNILNRQDITTTATSSFYNLGRNFMLGYEYSF